jgi:phage-related protein
MGPEDKPLAWLHGEIRTPPMSASTRVEAGVLLRGLQQGEILGLPHSRSMARIGARCHELRVQDENQAWRILYRVDRDAILILDVFSKKTQVTPKSVIEACRRRLRSYDALNE